MSELIELDDLKHKDILKDLYFYQKQCKDLTLTFWTYENDDGQLMKLEHRYGLINVRYRKILIDEWCTTPISNNRKIDVQKCSRIYDIDEFISINKENMKKTDRKFIEMIELKNEVVNIIGEYSLYNSFEYIWNIQTNKLQLKITLGCYNSEILIETNLKHFENKIDKDTLLMFLNENQKLILKEISYKKNENSKVVNISLDDNIDEIKVDGKVEDAKNETRESSSNKRSFIEKLFVKMPKDKKIEYQTCKPKWII